MLPVRGMLSVSLLCAGIIGHRDRCRSESSVHHPYLLVVVLPQVYVALFG